MLLTCACIAEDAICDHFPTLLPAMCKACSPPLTMATASRIHVCAFGHMPLRQGHALLSVVHLIGTIWVEAVPAPYAWIDTWKTFELRYSS